MRLNKTHPLEVAKAAAEAAHHAVKAIERSDDAVWLSAANPFEALKRYQSAARRKARQSAYRAWLAASAALNAIKPRRIRYAYEKL